MSDFTDKAFEELASKIPARYRVKTTTYLQGLLSALAEGDGFIQSQVEAVRDNLLVITASGKQLDRLASLYGIVRGQGTGVQDDDFKRLVPVLGYSPKQIAHSLQRVIDVIYGPYASHANTTCSAPAPYKILPRSFLHVRVDGQDVFIFFKTTDAADLSQATAQEIATAISDHTQGRIVGSVVTNTRTGEEFVNIRTATIGSQGFIQVLGGEVQAVMRFPQIRPTRQAVATWNISRYLGTDELLFTAVSGVSPGLRTAGVKRGDLVTIRPDSGFDPANTGSFQVTFVEEDSFRAQIGGGVPQVSVTQQHLDDFVFYRPDLGNILLTSRPATILQTASKELTVILPVTSPIVKRTLSGGHRYHGGLAVAVESTLTTLTLGSTTGFPQSGEVHVVISRIANEGVCSNVGVNTINLVNGEGWPSNGAAYSPVTQSFYYYSGKAGNALTGVLPQPPTSLGGSPLKFSQRYSYNGLSGNVLLNVYPDPAGAVGFEVTSRIFLDPKFFGAFMYDTSAPFVAAENETTLKENIQQGSSRTVVTVNDVSHFPESGFLVLEYGTNEQEGPVKYLGKVGSGAMIIDPGHVFLRDHLAGTTLRLLRTVGTYVPRPTGDDYPVYMTGTSQARTLLAQYLADIVAAGVTLKFVILVPDQKWPVLPLLHSDKPLDKQLATF